MGAAWHRITYLLNKDNLLNYIVTGLNDGSPNTILRVKTAQKLYLEKPETYSEKIQDIGTMSYNQSVLLNLIITTLLVKFLSKNLLAP